MAGGLAVVKFIRPRNIAAAVRYLRGLQPDTGLPGVEEDLTPPWGVEGPEVEPPDEGGLPTHPIVPAEPEDPEIWPPLEVVPPIQPTPEHFYVAVYHPAIGLRYVKFHGPTMKERLQALKDRLPAGGVGGRPPQRPG